MRFGICAPLPQAEWIRDQGFHYIEPRLKNVAEMGPEDIEAARKTLAKLAIQAETFNLFCASDLRLSCNVDEDALRSYTKVAFAKAARLGGEIIVVGSSKARAILAGFSLEEAKDSFARTLDILADIAKDYHLKIAIEPLNRKETDLVNTLADAAEICEKVSRPEVGALVDLYHFYQNGEDMADIKRYSEYIIHTHIARRNDDRGAPCLENGANDARDFIAALEDAGYHGRMSLESSSKLGFENSVIGYAQLLRHLIVL